VKRTPVLRSVRSWRPGISLIAIALAVACASQSPGAGGGAGTSPSASPSPSPTATYELRDDQALTSACQSATALRQAFEDIMALDQHEVPQSISSVMDEHRGNLARIAYHPALAEVRDDLLDMTIVADDLKGLRSIAAARRGVATATGVLAKLPPCTLEEEEEPPSPEPEEEPAEGVTDTDVVAEYSGSGIQTTRPFTVDGPWEIRWRATGDVFQIYVYQGSSRVPYDVAANDICPCRGRDYQPQGGSFRLDINAIGEWTVTIVQV
jgi:hypothetical protein